MNGIASNSVAKSVKRITTQSSLPYIPNQPTAEDIKLKDVWIHRGFNLFR